MVADWLEEEADWLEADWLAEATVADSLGEEESDWLKEEPFWLEEASGWLEPAEEWLEAGWSV